MVNTTKKPRITRLASLLLALVMVLSMFPVTAFAAGESLKVTNVAGEEVTTFAQGEPIYVTASSNSNGAWIGLFKPDNVGSDSQMWYYTNYTAGTGDGQSWDSENGGTYNLYTSVLQYEDAANGKFLPAGNYVIAFGNNTNVRVNVEIVKPTDTTKSLEITNPESGKILSKATCYSNSAWVGLYKGTINIGDTIPTSEQFYYLNGYNGDYYEFTYSTPGDYTVMVFKDGGYDAVCAEHITVSLTEDPVVPPVTDYFSTEKTEFMYGEEIIINLDSNYTPLEKDWIGIYKKGETPGVEKAIYWHRASWLDGNSIILADCLDEGGRLRTDFVPNTEYVLYLCYNDGYEILDKVEIKVTNEFVETLKVTSGEATCTKSTTTTYYYHNGAGNSKYVYGDPVSNNDALDHVMSDFAPTYTSDAFGNKADSKYTHTKSCSRECGEEGATVTEACVWNEGVEAEGYVLYTCTICSGTVKHVDKEVDGEPVVVAPTCMNKGYTQINYVDGTYIRVAEVKELGHDYGEWIHDDENGGHSHTCIRENCDKDETATVVELNCSDAAPAIDGNPKNNCFNYKCDKCGFEWGESVIVLEDDDAIYHLNDLVKVKLNKDYTYSTGKQWIGLYKADEVPSESTSMWYQYLSDVMKGDANPNGNPYGYFDISQKHTANNDRNLAGYGVGKYQIYLSNTSSYDDAAVMYFEVVDCTYDQKIESDKYLKEGTANCQTGATYYYSCTCGAVDKSANANTFVGEKNPENHTKYLTWSHNETTHQKLYPCCNTTVGEALPHADDVADHKCDTCEKVLSTCADANPKDHKCDVCGKPLTTCADNDNNHKCDTCSKELSKCADNNKDHECDTCEATMGKHEDTNKDHACEYGCNFIIGACDDTDKDHKCDYGCNESFGVCEDTNNDGKCDYGCDKKFEIEEPKPEDPTDPEDPTIPEEPGEDTKIPAVEGTTRLAGDNRLITSYLVADMLKEQMGVEKFNAVIVASGGTFADALPGSYLSAVKNAPILLTLAKDKFINQTADYIKANLVEGGTVYILGGESAVPASMEKALAGFNVQRVAGADRFGTNLEILKTAGVKAGDEVLVCEAKGYADSLSASATGKPVLLVYKKLTDAQKAYLATLSGCSFTVVGGTTAVPEKLAQEIEAYGTVTRLAGKDRLETSTMVAEKYFGSATTAVVAYGWDFPDGLCGGSLAYAMKAPLILTHSKAKLYGFTAAYTTKAGITDGFVLGGDGLVSDEATKAIFGMTSGEITVLK